MKPHEERVIAEWDDVLAKADKLDAFLGTSTFDALDDANRNLLAAQLGTMYAYANILEARINLFEKE